MAIKEHINILMEGDLAWNKWRDDNSNIEPDLSGTNLTSGDAYDVVLCEVNFSNTDLTGVVLSEVTLLRANLRGACLDEADLRGTDLRKADLRDASLRHADLERANLHKSNLIGSDLRDSNLSGSNLAEAKLNGATLLRANLFKAHLRDADLSGADLRQSELSRADLSGAILRGANLEFSRLVETNLARTILTGCRVYGISAWGINSENIVEQDDIRFTPENEPAVTTDNLEMAQFLYLMLDNKKIREVIDAITSKAVLILGRFTAERKQILDAIRNALRLRGYLPILCDFEKPKSKNLTETITTLANMSRFVIADITDAKSIPQELERIIPNSPSLPVQPIILEADNEYGMFESFADYPWVLTPFRYKDMEHLIIALEHKVIDPAENEVRQIEGRRHSFRA